MGWLDLTVAPEGKPEVKKNPVTQQVEISAQLTLADPDSRVTVLLNPDQVRSLSADLAEWSFVLGPATPEAVPA